MGRIFKDSTNGEAGVLKDNISFRLEELCGFEICRDILVLSLVEEGIEEIFEDSLIFQRLGFGFPSVFGGVDTLVSIS